MNIREKQKQKNNIYTPKKKTKHSGDLTVNEQWTVAIYISFLPDVHTCSIAQGYGEKVGSPLPPPRMVVLWCLKATNYHNTELEHSARDWK